MRVCIIELIVILYIAKYFCCLKDVNKDYELIHYYSAVSLYVVFKLCCCLKVWRNNFKSKIVNIYLSSFLSSINCKIFETTYVENSASLWSRNDLMIVLIISSLGFLVNKISAAMARDERSCFISIWLNTFRSAFAF